MLTGADLLAKVKELGDISKSDLVRSCGYVSTKKDGTEYCQFYMDCAEFSIPPSERKDVGAPSPTSAPVRTSPAPQRQLLQRQDPPDDDDSIPF